MKFPGTTSKKEKIDEMIRVNHAGEYGAKRIYEGQLAVLKNSKSYEIIKNMAQQEERHLKYFENKIIERQIRPTLLQPFWHIAGFSLGAITALMGEKSAMACTEAIETVIDKHYQKQIAELDNSENELKENIERFRLEELEHKNEAIKYHSQDSFSYNFLTKTIKLSCKIAIALAKKI